MTRLHAGFGLADFAIGGIPANALFIFIGFFRTSGKEALQPSAERMRYKQ